MHQLGLKIWSTNDFYIKPMRELYENKVFDYLELYVVPNSGMKYLKDWAQLSLPISLHAPHSNAGFNLSVAGFEASNRILLQEVEAFRKELNPVMVIFHPGTNGSIEETIRQVKLFQKEFPKLFEIAIMENKPKLGLKGEDCIGASVEEITQLLEQTGLGFCLDMGHAICYAAWKGVPYQGVLEQFIKLKPKMYHLSDGDVQSKVDMHLNFGKGNFNLQELISLIPSEAHVSIETDKKSKTDLDDFKEDAAYFRICAQELNLREAKDSDSQDLYEWRNHPIVRKNSFNSTPFSFEDHQKWFQSKKQSSQTTIYIATLRDTKVGMIRFEDEQQGVKVNVMLNPHYIGKGLGTRLIASGVNKLHQQKKLSKSIVAEIKEDNITSIRAFEKAGFKKNDLAYVLDPRNL